MPWTPEDYIKATVANFHLTKPKDISALDSATAEFRKATGQPACTISSMGADLHAKNPDGTITMTPAEIHEADGMRAKKCAENAINNSAATSNMRALVKYVSKIDAIKPVR